jgi:hypothetical protein
MVAALVVLCAVCDYLSDWCRALRRHQGTTKLGGVTGPVGGVETVCVNGDSARSC